MIHTDYYITGIWMSADKRSIAYVKLHRFDASEGLQPGVKTSDTEVIRLLENGNRIRTAIWDYARAKWFGKVEVVVGELNGVKFLRTVPDDVEANNLLHLIHMKYL